MKKTLIILILFGYFTKKTSLGAASDGFVPDVVSKYTPVEAMLLAFMLRSECHDCHRDEKESLCYIILKRAKSNYGGFGHTIKKQLFAPNQIHGVKTTNFNFNSGEQLDEENLAVAESILGGKIPRYHCDGCYSFSMGGVGIKTPDYFKHKIKVK